MYKYALVLVDVAKLGTRTFSYLIPDEMKPVIKIGQPVIVPFGRSRKVKAYVVGFCNYLEEGIKAKYIGEILDLEPLFTLEYLKLLEWVANYYFCDLPTVLKTALPQKFFEKNVKKYRKPKKENAVFKGDKELQQEHKLSGEQEKIYKEIKHVNAKNSLLYGITGSGKTEIYFKLIEDTIKKGKNVLFLAPEIALVSQLTMRTVKRFGADNVAIWHSSISEAEKYEVWQKLRNNDLKILFGARSAVFAPEQNIGLIIIDEEHDSSYKQTMPNPRYCAKEVANKLADLHDAKIVRGSATPDIESYWQAKNTNSLFELKNRYNNAQLPDVSIIDMKSERADGNLGIFSKTLINKTKETVESGNQVIFLINRRGFSTYTQCMECGEVLECKKCAIPLIYHSQSNSWRCHYCGYEIKEAKCQHCDSEELENFGTGSQRVEEIANKIFEGYRIARLDSDSLNKKNEHIEILKKFQEGEIDILIGTQMIAKGLDNPNVTLVGVINADLSFNLPDYRSSERGFSLLTQVAGRSGRGEAKGKVIFQTYNAQNLFLQKAKEQDYISFFEKEIELREEYDYPPYAKIIRIIVSSKEDFSAEHACVEIALHLRNYIKKLSLDERLITLGPTPCVIGKIRGEYRYNILIKNKLAQKGHSAILDFLRRITLCDEIKMVVDVDPSDIL